MFCKKNGCSQKICKPEQLDISIYLKSHRIMEDTKYVDNVYLQDLPM